MVVAAAERDLDAAVRSRGAGGGSVRAGADVVTRERVRIGVDFYVCGRGEEEEGW